jgi:hypothetical protein
MSKIDSRVHNSLEIHFAKTPHYPVHSQYLAWAAFNHDECALLQAMYHTLILAQAHVRGEWLLPPVYGSALEVMYMCSEIKRIYYSCNHMEMKTQWPQRPHCILRTWQEKEYITFDCFNCGIEKSPLGQLLVDLMQPEYSLVRTEPRCSSIADYEMHFLMNTLKHLKEKVSPQAYAQYFRQNVNPNYNILTSASEPLLHTTTMLQNNNNLQNADDIIHIKKLKIQMTLEHEEKYKVLFLHLPIDTKQRELARSAYQTWLIFMTLHQGTLDLESLTLSVTSDNASEVYRANGLIPQPLCGHSIWEILFIMQEVTIGVLDIMGETNPNPMYFPLNHWKEKYKSPHDDMSFYLRNEIRSLTNILKTMTTTEFNRERRWNAASVFYDHTPHGTIDDIINHEMEEMQDWEIPPLFSTVPPLFTRKTFRYSSKTPTYP